MVDKYIGLVNGRQTEIAGTTASAGVADAGKLIALDSSGKLDSSLMPAGLVDETDILTAGEALSAGNYVYISQVDGKVYKADASNTSKGADGYVLASAASNASVRVYYEGANTGVTGYTPGARYYLSATVPGDATSTAPSYAGGGRILQYLGKAVSATKLVFEASETIIVAA